MPLFIVHKIENVGALMPVKRSIIIYPYTYYIIIYEIIIIFQDRQ